MRRLLILGVVAAVLTVVSIPASAQGGGPPCIPQANGNGAATCTANMHDFTFILPGPPPCSGLTAGNTALTGNTIAHVTVSPDGNEFWATETLEGSFVNPDVGAALATGHVTAWFGIEFNNQNQVIHGTIDGNGTDAVLGRFGFHENFDMTTNANGDVTAFHADFNCR